MLYSVKLPLPNGDGCDGHRDVSELIIAGELHLVIVESFKLLYSRCSEWLINVVVAGRNTETLIL